MHSRIIHHAIHTRDLFGTGVIDTEPRRTPDRISEAIATTIAPVMDMRPRSSSQVHSHGSINETSFNPTELDRIHSEHFRGATRNSSKLGVGTTSPQLLGLGDDGRLVCCVFAEMPMQRLQQNSHHRSAKPANFATTLWTYKLQSVLHVHSMQAFLHIFIPAAPKQKTAVNIIMSATGHILAGGMAQ